jgi:hypothetical protein
MAVVELDGVTKAYESKVWFSSRLYRVGILMYGKRATLPELVRWLPYS